MDNLSHSLAGLAAAELVHRSLAPEPDAGQHRTRRSLLLAGGWAACNFPDLDLLLTPLLPAPLGYLLHHRGHTHTLLYAIPQALLLYALLWALWPAARGVLRASSQARRGLALSIAAGLLLHLLMDYFNSYGIHPFYPFDARWYYGDMVFILEPVFWTAFGIPLAMMVARKKFRRLLLGVLTAAPLAFTASGHLAPASAGALLVLAAGLGLLQHRTGPYGRRALAAAFALAGAFVLLAGVASSHGRAIVEARLGALDPALRTVDVALSPFPANLLCWSFVAVGRDADGGKLRLTRGILALAPGLLAARDCPAAFAEPGAPQAPAGAVAIVWQRDTPLAELRARRHASCNFDAWLRFARAPALDAAGATDVRFGVDPARNFSTMRDAAFASMACPDGVPGWGYPRADLLQP